jgi:hypothetical protein
VALDLDPQAALDSAGSQPAFWHPTFMLRPAIFAGKHGWRMQQLTSKKITKGWAQHMSKCWFRIPHNYPEISKTKHIWYT